MVEVRRIEQLPLNEVFRLGQHNLVRLVFLLNLDILHHLIPLTGDTLPIKLVYLVDAVHSDAVTGDDAELENHCGEDAETTLSSPCFHPIGRRVTQRHKYRIKSQKSNAH